MTTSTNQRSAPQVCGDHWLELTATLSPTATDEFSDWLDRELDQLERRLYSFVTPNSLNRSSRRSSQMVS